MTDSATQAIEPDRLVIRGNQHALRIRATLRRRYGVSHARFLLGRQRAARVRDLNPGERVLLGLYFALAAATQKPKAECVALLETVIEETR